MGWKRGYYYRSKRKGEHVITEYHGSDLLAALMFEQDARAQLRRALERAEIQAQKAEDKEVEVIFDQVDEMVRASLLATGCYQHHGQWRKRAR
jgi:hypothetical protein